MTDPFDHLEEQLRAQVAERASAPARRAGWRRPRGLAAVAGILGLGASGVAVAAGGLVGPGDEGRGRSIAWDVISETAAARPECQRPRVQQDGPVALVDAPLPQTVLDAFPWMATPATPGELARATGLIDTTNGIAGTRVVRSSVRIVRLDARWEVLVWLERGSGGFDVRDPSACQAVRRAALSRRLDGEGPGVRDWATRRLAEDTTANPEASTFWITSVSHGRPSMGGGSTLLPGPGRGPRYEVPRGLLSYGPTAMRNAPGAPRARAYLGLADAGSTHLRVSAPRASRSVRRTLPRTVSLHQGFWRLVLPPGTGPVRLTELGADGKRVRVVRLRS